MNMESIAAHIESWLSAYARKAQMKGWVVGVSGGIDSAVTSTLCARTGLPTYVVEMPIHQHASQVTRARNHIEQLEKAHHQMFNLFVLTSRQSMTLLREYCLKGMIIQVDWRWQIRGLDCA